MKEAIIIGSGAGGATAAKELAGKYKVTVLEAGSSFRPFSLSLTMLEKLRKTGLFISEKEISLLFPAMKIGKTKDHMVLVRGIGIGGTTTLSAGNALRQDDDLKKLGICLDEEFEEIYREIPVTADHSHLWTKTTTQMFEICRDMNLNPQPLPKMGDYSRCVGCGQCVLGCRRNAKWDSRRYLEEATARGAQLITDCKVTDIVIKNNKAIGINAHIGHRKTFLSADLVILSAGGLSTPEILYNSGIECENRLFVDPVLCVAAQYRDCFQNREISMPFVVQREHYIISPYFDHLSFFFNRKWRYPSQNIVSLMIKLKDSNCGSVRSGKAIKSLTPLDMERMHDGIQLCTSILVRLGINPSRLFLGTINAGHPGGMLPLTKDEAENLHNPRLPDNLYVADATLLPDSLGNPPILTIIALAKRISKLCLQKV